MKYFSTDSSAPEAAAFRRVLVMTAVAAERDAVLRGLNHHKKMDIHVHLAGVGPAAAAASTAVILAGGAYELVISAGIGGGFQSVAKTGSLVIASEIIAADLGVETAEGFAAVDELGFGSSRVPVQNNVSSRWRESLERKGLPVHYGPVLTLSTATGTAATAAKLARRIPGAAAEAMEGYGVAAAARQCGIPVLEIRAISNQVGPRRRELWKIDEALLALERGFSILPEVLLS